MSSNIMIFFKNEFLHRLKRMEMFGSSPLEWEAGLLGTVVSLSIALDMDFPVETTIDLWRQERSRLINNNPLRLLCEISNNLVFENIEQDMIKINKAKNIVFAGLSMVYIDLKAFFIEKKPKPRFLDFQNTNRLESYIINSISRKDISFFPKNIPIFHEAFITSLFILFYSSYVIDYPEFQFNKYVTSLCCDAHPHCRYSFYDDRNFNYKEKIDTEKSKLQIQKGIINMVNIICPEMKL